MYGDFPAKNTVYTPYMPINVWFGQPCSFALRSPKLVEIIAAVPEEHKASLMPQLKVCAPNVAADCSLFFLCVLPTILKKPRPPSLMPQLKVCAPNEAADCFLFFSLCSACHIENVKASLPHASAQGMRTK